MDELEADLFGTELADLLPQPVPGTHWFGFCDRGDTVDWHRRVSRQLEAAKLAPCSLLWATQRHLAGPVGQQLALAYAGGNAVLPELPDHLAAPIETQVTPAGPSVFAARTWRKLRALGSGSYGTVYAGQHRATDVVAAVKEVPKPGGGEDAAREWAVLQSEIEALERVKLGGGHRSLLHLHEVLETPDKLYVVTELVPGVDLVRHVRNVASDRAKAAEAAKAADGGSLPTRGRSRRGIGLASSAGLCPAPTGHGGLPEAQARPLFSQLATAVLVLHKAGIVHRDLKPENVQLQEEAGAEAGAAQAAAEAAAADRPKATSALQPGASGQAPDEAVPGRRLVVLDFGFAAVSNQLQQIPGRRQLEWGIRPMDLRVGTKYAIAPEIAAKDETYTEAVDAWGIGVILFWMLLGRAPFPDEGGAAAMLERIVGQPPQLTAAEQEALSPEAQELIAQLLLRDPAARLSVKGALLHAWTSGRC